MLRVRTATDYESPMRPDIKPFALIWAFFGYCFLSVFPAAAAEGFISLFNGKDLSGWISVGPQEAFQIEKGAILSTGASPYPSWLRTEKDALGQSTGIEVQCFNCPDSTNPTGSLYDIAPADHLASQDNQWFLLQIFVDGPHSMVLVNGEKVSQTDQLKSPDHGAIGFQQHTPGGHIEYRGARIREIHWR